MLDRSRMILRAAALAALAWLAPVSAEAASCPTFSNGLVLTAGQWQACFDAKQNALGYTPVNKAGDTMLGPLITFPSAASAAGLRIPPGTAPSSPVNGDIWSTSSGLFVRINGVTIGPLSGGTSSSFAGTSPITVSFPAGVVTYAFDLSVANTFTASQTVSKATTTSPGWYAQLTGDSVPRIRVGLNATDIASIGFGSGSATRDAFIERVGAGALRFGAVDAAAPVAQTISVQNVVAGTSNTAGATLTIAGSQGTGTGVGGSIVLQVASAGSTGTAQNALAAALTIDSTKKATFAGALSIAGALTYGGVTLSASVVGTGAMVLATAPSVSSLTVTTAFTATGLVTNADLVNASTTVNGTTCTLGSPCTITATAASITVGTTTVLSGATLGIFYQNGASPTGTIGQYTLSGTGTAVAMATGPTISSLTVTTAFTATGLVGLPALATQAAWTFVGNFTAGSASPTAVNPSAFTHKSSPSGSDLLILTDVSASNATKYTTISEALAGAGSGTVTSVTVAGTASQIGASGTCTITTTGTCTLASLIAPQCGYYAFSSTTATTFTPLNCDQIKINGALSAIPSGGITGCGNTSVFVNGSGASNLAASTLYYVYAFLNSGTVTCDFSTTAYATSSTAGNVGTVIKSGDDTRTLIGLVYTNSSSQFANITTASWFNRKTKVASVSGTMGSAANSTVIDFVAFGDEAYTINSITSIDSNSANAFNVNQLQIDSGNVGGELVCDTVSATVTRCAIPGPYWITSSTGKHTFRTTSNSSGGSPTYNYNNQVAIRG